MRQIKASAVKPGMTIRWGRWDISYQCTLTRVERFNGDQDVQGETRQGKTVLLHEDDDVLVVKEPPQPEEPQEFGAKVVVAGERALRIAQGSWLTDGLERCTWDDLCEMGPVTIIDANPSWTAPADREPTPEVPERIEEWPEDDTALRLYPWRDRRGRGWSHGFTGFETGWECYDVAGNHVESAGRPSYGPWTRVADA